MAGRSPGIAGNIVAPSLNVLLIALLTAVIFVIVSLYGDALRDPRYFDGWVLAGGMGLQLGFHAAVKTNRLSPKSVMRWRRIHIFIGYLLIGAFLSHTNFSLPETNFEWGLWAGFVLVTASGIFGTYLTWSLKIKGGIDDNISYDRIPARLSELAQEALDVVATPDPGAAIALPSPQYDAWIHDLYDHHLRDFFAGPRNFAAHLIGSQRPLKRLSGEVDALSRYVDAQGQTKLDAISRLLAEKDRLDFARVHLGLTKAWLFVHVPITYGLIVLSVLHVFVVYSYSSGAW